MRSLKTFALRVQQHNANGLALAACLETHPKVRRVYYPGLVSHPSHTIARQQMRGFSGVVSFEIDGTLEQPALMSYYELASEERQQLGIGDSLVRYAAGIEDTDDLLSEVEQALKVCL